MEGARSQILGGSINSEPPGRPLPISVFMWTASPPTDLLGETDENTLEPTVDPGTVHYWQVHSTEDQGKRTASKGFELRTDP